MAALPSLVAYLLALFGMGTDEGTVPDLGSLDPEDTVDLLLLAADALPPDMAATVVSAGQAAAGLATPVQVLAAVNHAAVEAGFDPSAAAVVVDAAAAAEQPDVDVEVPGHLLDSPLGFGGGVSTGESTDAPEIDQTAFGAGAADAGGIAGWEGVGDIGAVEGIGALLDRTVGLADAVGSAPVVVDPLVAEIDEPEPLLAGPATDPELGEGPVPDHDL